MPHLTVDQIIDYAVNPALLPDRAAAEAHLATCEQCRDLLVKARQFEQAFQHPDTRAMRDEVSGIAAAGRDIDAFEVRMAEEDEAAAVLLEDVLASPGELVWKNAGHDARYYTTGVVRLLSKTAKQLCASKPRVARALAEQAILIAEVLDEARYPAAVVDELRGMAWKDLGNAQRIIGLYPEAHEAFDRAERALRRLPAPEFHLAIVQLARAIVCMKQEALAEAEKLTLGSAEVFARHGAIGRHVDAKLTLAAIFAKRGDHERAQAMNVDLVAYGDAQSDVLLVARASKNLGYVALECGDLAEATRQYERALQIYTRLDATVEVLRVRWSLALIVLALGRREEAIRLLREVLDAFIRRGVLMAAAMVALDLAKPLLADGTLRRRREVTQMCARLTREFRASQMETSAMTALAYFREALRDPHADPETIESARQRVRAFLDRVEDQPHLPFASPAGR